MMTKEDIRRMMRERRRAVSSAERDVAACVVSAKLLARVDVREAIATRAPIAVYLATKDEIDLSSFISAALSQGALLVAPRWNGSSYEFAAFASPTDLVAGPHDILEPPTANGSRSVVPWLVLVPGLAFTCRGGRLGYGGGWYDRLLGGGEVVSLGVCYRFQVLGDLPLEPHDRLLNDIIEA